MCFDSKSFISLTLLSVPISITLSYSYRLLVTHVGSVPNLTLQNVLHVPVFKYNLLSVHKLCYQFKCDVLFTPSGCILQDPLMRITQAFGEVREGLYLLQPISPRSKSIENVFSFQEGSNSISNSSHVSVPVSTNVVPNCRSLACKVGSCSLFNNEISVSYTLLLILIFFVLFVLKLDKLDCLFH